MAICLKLGRFRNKIRVQQGHILILGRSGAGKSNTAKVLVEELSKRNIPVLILDWAGEYRNIERLIPGDNFSLDLTSTGGADDPETVDTIVDLFDSTFHFTAPQLYIMRLAVKQALSRSLTGIEGLLEALEEIPTRSYYDHEVKAALTRRLAPLSEGRASRALRRGLMPSDFFNSSYSIDLSVFRSTYIKRLFSLLLLKALYDEARSRPTTSEIRHATLIEESWNVIPYRRLDTEPSVGERLFAELRKYGECLIAVAQNPSEIAWGIVNNAEVLLLHAMLPREFEVLGIRELHGLALERGHVIVVERGHLRLVKVRKAVNM
ncbi:MAG: ATP-binding protein [Thermofilaceae archaeon]|nr:ATP-binding protein [Thermofilaceae archaeon]MCX8181147.1 ATP-binding protein [Thermofilaceae archaeon]MDW8004770.1 DUF87 domain-containing protein [Thermofilaceae archaeon]